MKIWGEPDIFKSNQPNSLERFNQQFQYRRKQYKYDESKMNQVKHIVDELNEKGYTILKNVVDKELLQTVRDDAEKIWDEGINVKGASGKFSQLNKPDDAFELAVKDPLYNCPSIAPLVFNDISFMVATALFECIPAIGTLNLRKSFVNPNTEARGTQQWHVDRNSPRIMKTFMYLNDVDQDGGPFCVVEGSRKNLRYGMDGQPFFYSNPHRMSDEWVKMTFGGDKIKKLTANMGDMIISNQTGAYHKGLKPTKNERAMLTTNWVIHSEEFKPGVFKVREKDYQDLPDYKKPLTDFLVRTP
tara:strand:- start:4430 stop:5332 length:903 start_codon:yes stop_codon:yes gene_type:complete